MPPIRPVNVVEEDATILAEFGADYACQQHGSAKPEFLQVPVLLYTYPERRLV